MDQLTAEPGRGRRSPDTPRRRLLDTGRDRRYERLEAALRLYRAGLFLCLLALVVLILAMLFGQRRHIGRAILVDGKVVCFTDSKSAAEQVRLALLSGPQGPLAGATFRERWTEEDRPMGDDQPLSVQDAAARLKPVLTVLVPATAISVEGHPLVLLSDRDTAEKTLEVLKSRFLGSGEKLVEPQRLANRVELQDLQVPPSHVLTDVAQAVERLLKGSTESYPYVVKREDTLERIAEQFAVSRAELLAATPALRRGLPPVGKTLEIKVTVPAVRVITIKEVTKEQVYTVPPKQTLTATLAQGEKRSLTSGQPGRKRTRLKQTWENDKLVRSVVLQTEIAEAAVPGEVLVGQKTGPDLTPAR